MFGTLSSRMPTIADTTGSAIAILPRVIMSAGVLTFRGSMPVGSTIFVSFMPFDASQVRVAARKRACDP